MDDPEFYEEITNNVKDSENPKLIAGDFNMVWTQIWIVKIIIISITLGLAIRF